MNLVIVNNKKKKSFEISQGVNLNTRCGFARRFPEPPPESSVWDRMWTEVIQSGEGSTFRVNRQKGATGRTSERFDTVKIRSVFLQRKEADGGFVIHTCETTREWSVFRLHYTRIKSRRRCFSPNLTTLLFYPPSLSWSMVTECVTHLSHFFSLFSFFFSFFTPSRFLILCKNPPL